MFLGGKQYAYPNLQKLRLQLPSSPTGVANVSHQLEGGWARMDVSLE